MIYSNIPADVFIDNTRGRRYYGTTKKTIKKSTLYTMTQEVKWGYYLVELKRPGYKTMKKATHFPKGVSEDKLFFNLEKKRHTV